MTPRRVYPPHPPPGGSKIAIFGPPREMPPRGPPGEGPDPPRLTPPCRPPRARGVFTVFRPILGEKKVNAGGGAFFSIFRLMHSLRPFIASIESRTRES
jgi:hypothetical protein